MTLKNQITEQARKVREAAQLSDPLAVAVVSLLQMTIEDLKESLVSAEGEDMYRTQGAVRHFSRLHRELTVTPHSLRTPE